MDPHLLNVILGGYFTVLAVGYAVGVSRKPDNWADAAGVFIVIAGLTGLIVVLVSLIIGFIEGVT